MLIGVVVVHRAVVDRVVDDIVAVDRIVVDEVADNRAVVDRAVDDRAVADAIIHMRVPAKVRQANQVFKYCVKQAAGATDELDMNLILDT